MSPAVPVERREESSRLAVLESQMTGLTEWVKTLDKKVEALSTSFAVGETKLDQILEKLKESAQERKEQRDEIAKQSEAMRKYGEELAAHMSREETQMTGMMRRMDVLHDEIVDGDTRVMSAFQSANNESKSDRKAIWDTVYNCQGIHIDDKLVDEKPVTAPHWADKLIAIVRDNLFGLLGKAIALVIAGYLVLGLNDMSAALKVVTAKVETVVPK